MQSSRELFFPPAESFRGWNSVLKWAPRSIACKLDLANCTRKRRSISVEVCIREPRWETATLSRNSADPWQMRANKFFTINRITLFHCVTLLQARSTLLLDTYRRETSYGSVDCYRLVRSAVLHSGHFSPPRCRCCTWPRLQGSPPLPDRLSSEDYSNFTMIRIQPRRFSPFPPRHTLLNYPRVFVSTFGTLRDCHASDLSLVIAREMIIEYVIR